MQKRQAADLQYDTADAYPKIRECSPRLDELIPVSERWTTHHCRKKAFISELESLYVLWEKKAFYTTSL